MIPIADLIPFFLAIPKCKLEPPNDAGCQFIKDAKGNPVGEIHWVLMDITIYKDYEYCEDVIQKVESMTGKKFKKLDKLIED